MSLFFAYLIKFSIGLAAVYLFYRFVLRKLTFYNWNRWYLLGYTFLSFFIAAINITPLLQQNKLADSKTIQWVPSLDLSDQNSQVNDTVTKASGQWSIWNWTVFILMAGTIVLLARLFIQYLSFLRIRSKAELLSDNGMRIYQVEGDIIPFSFGNSIFINQKLHTEQELQEIIRHEFVHVKQRHSIDILWSEVLCILNWYNPFAWLLRHAIRQNLEFIADNKVVSNGIDRKQYQYLLLKVIGNNHFSIAPKFNFSSLKKRIAMMNKLRSAKVHLLKFLFVLPVALVMLLAFRSKYEKPQQSVSGLAGNVLQDTLPGKIKLPDAISSISLLQPKSEAGAIDPVKHKLVGLVMVKRKDGGKEIYDLDKDESRDDFEKKYAARLEDLILPPPPPPPPPPTLPEGVKDMSLNAENIVTISLENGAIERFNLNKEGEKQSFEKKYGKFPTAPKTPAPSVVGYEYGLSVISSEYEITDKKAFLKLKDGTIENYNLQNKEERAAFEKKYGKIININTNVNASIDVTPMAVTIDGVPITSTVAPVSVAGIHSATTMVAPAKIAKGVSAISVTPSPTRNAVAGTTIIAPMSATEGVTIIDDYGTTITGNEDIMIVISNKTTRQELENYKKQMNAKGIELSYDEIEYNDKGLLVSISGTMKGKDGQSNFVANDFDKLVLAMIKKGDKTWFKVSVKDKEVI